MKIPAVFGEIGGIIQAFMLIGRSLVFFLSKNSMLSYLILQIFDNDEITQMLASDAKSSCHNNLELKNSPIDASDPNSDFITKFNKLQLEKKSYVKNDFNNIGYLNRIKRGKLEDLGANKSFSADVGGGIEDLNYKADDCFNRNNINNDFKGFPKENIINYNNINNVNNNKKHSSELIRVRKPIENVNYNNYRSNNNDNEEIDTGNKVNRNGKNKINNNNRINNIYDKNIDNVCKISLPIKNDNEIYYSEAQNKLNKNEDERNNNLNENPNKNSSNFNFDLNNLNKNDNSDFNNLNDEVQKKDNEKYFFRNL